MKGGGCGFPGFRGDDLKWGEGKDSGGLRPLSKQCQTARKLVTFYRSPLT